jgi:hypothetical protein
LMWSGIFEQNFRESEGNKSNFKGVPEIPN